MIAAGKDKTACLVESCLLHNGRGGQYLRHENIEAYPVSVSSVCSVGEVILGGCREDSEAALQCVSLAISQAQQ